jgi:succinate dehydrogenase hydrophobic anchor subunit
VNVPLALLSGISLVILVTVLTFAMAVNEQVAWPEIWRETRRRWVKLMLILLAIAAVVELLTVVSASL